MKNLFCFPETWQKPTKQMFFAGFQTGSSGFIGFIQVIRSAKSAKTGRFLKLSMNPMNFDEL
jgi:hypothetical protein